MALSISLSQATMDTTRVAGPYLNASFEWRHAVDFRANFHNIITEVDTGSQHIVLACVFAAYPDSLTVSEEVEDLLDKSGTVRPLTDEDIMWYIDPIDGTSNLATGFDHWYISITAARGGELLADAVYQPTRDFIFHASETGTYRNGERVSVSTASFVEGIVGIEFPSPRINDVDAALRDFGRLLGSAYSPKRTESTALILTEVAAGSFLVTFNAGAKPQDVAAGVLLVERTSGCFIRWGDGADESANATAGGPGSGTSEDGADAQSVYRRNTWTVPNFITADTPKAARTCLVTVGHPDPDATIAVAQGEPPGDR